MLKSAIATTQKCPPENQGRRFNTVDVDLEEFDDRASRYRNPSMNRFHKSRKDGHQDKAKQIFKKNQAIIYQDNLDLAKFVNEQDYNSKNPRGGYKLNNTSDFNNKRKHSDNNIVTEIGDRETIMYNNNIFEFVDSRNTTNCFNSKNSIKKQVCIDMNRNYQTIGFPYNNLDNCYIGTQQQQIKSDSKNCNTKYLTNGKIELQMARDRKDYKNTGNKKTHYKIPLNVG